MLAHTTVAALADGFYVVFEDAHAQVDAGMVGVVKIGVKGVRVSNLVNI